MIMLTFYTNVVFYIVLLLYFFNFYVIFDKTIYF